MKKIKKFLFKPFTATIPLVPVTDDTMNSFWNGFWDVLHFIAVHLDKL